jgi:hypothetical protein
MRDFTLNVYEKLLKALGPGDYSVINYLRGKNSYILRHDVERMIGNALEMARVENKAGIRSTYYFRVPYSFNVKIIDEIHTLGHEIGYHYETLAKAKGDYSKAILMFENELRMFKRWNIKTISMHGSPTSRFNNHDLWKKYDFKTLDLSEAYLSVDLKNIPYATDTGRSWNNTKISRRDKVETDMPSIRNTSDLTRKIVTRELQRLYITTHPHRWTNNMISWTKELLWQNTKNIVKRMIL